ncbi:hypothetical protein [Photorhabdus heterorhabditis]|uniref:hypothetical protein n=1 Tax=Photorhabdus heterorhabditis TaxID=880156 RepID=UPI0021CDF64A|nr:hypothetical protein [Photorhabdus heterorhabditis]
MECVVTDNNALSLPKGVMDYGRSASSLATAMLNEGKSPQEISAALSKHAKGDQPGRTRSGKRIVSRLGGQVLLLWGVL